MKILCALILFLVSASLPGTSLAAEACAGPEFKQFDFWIGSWSVKNPAGKEIGGNEITSVSTGCALLEHWTGATGVTGVSISNYDPMGRRSIWWAVFPGRR